MRERPLAILLSVVVLLAACSSREERIAAGLRKAGDYARVAEWDKAGVELRNVLQMDPGNSAAYRLSGQVAEGRQDLQRAFGDYRKALELDTGDDDAKVGLARIYLVAGQAEQAERLAGEVLARDPGNAGASTIRAAVLARRGDVEGAVHLATEVIAAAPVPPVEASMLLAALESRRGDPGAALRAIEAALVAEPHHLGLLQVGARIASADPSPSAQHRAVELYRRASVEAPRNDANWIAWAQHYVAHGEIDAAEAVLRASVRAQPEDGRRVLALVEFLRERRGFDAAERECLAAIADRPRDPALRFGLANLYRGAQRHEAARQVLEEIADASKDSPAALTARTQLAADLLARGRVEAAQARIAEVLAVNPRDGAALVLRGRLRLASGDATGAIEDLRAAARDQPGSPEVVGLLAQAHHRAGEPQLAREVLAEAVKLRPQAVELRLLLAADMADAKEYGAAAAEADDAVRIAPKDLRVHDFKVQLAQARRDPAAAAAVWIAYKAQFPDDPAGAMKLGRLYAEERRVEAALREYDLAHRLAPDLPSPVSSAVMLLVEQRRFEAAEVRIDALEQRDSKGVLAWQLRGELAAARGDPEGAARAYSRLIEVAPAEPSGYLGLARVREGQQRAVEAVEVLARGERANAEAAVLPAARAQALMRAARYDEAIALYEALMARHPDDDAYANNLAYLLVEHKGDAGSLERALMLVRRFDDSRNPSYLDSLGWTYYRTGRYAEAAKVLERAAVRAPEVPLFQLHLGLALHRAGQAAEAEPHLRKAIESGAALPGVDEARVLLAQR